MDFVNLHAVVNDSVETTAHIQSAIEHATPKLLERIVELVAPAGSIVLLVGESGTGKSRIAQDAVRLFAQRSGAQLESITLLAPSNPLADVAAGLGVQAGFDVGDAGVFAVRTRGSTEGEVPGDPTQTEKRLIEVVTEVAKDESRGDPVVLVQGIDQYSASLTYLIDAIVRVPGVRLIATARGLNGAAAHLAGYPRATAVPVPALTFEESRSYLIHHLGVEEIESYSLRRWCDLTEGNSLSLLLLALTLDRAGRIGRNRGIAYERPGPTLVPPEFWEQLRSTCSDEELRTLEIIALTQPLGESALIRELDPQCLSTLWARGILKPQRSGGRRHELSLSHKLLAVAVREQMSSEQVQTVSRRLFDAVYAEQVGSPSQWSPAVLVRIVKLGIDARLALPCTVLFEALVASRTDNDPELHLRVANAILNHPDASTTQYATAAVNAVRTARDVGLPNELNRAWEHLRTAVERMRQTVPSSSLFRVKLELELVRHQAVQLRDLEGALTQLSRVEQGLDDALTPARVAVKGERATLLAAAGQLRTATALLPGPDAVGTMPIEWERSKSRVILSLVLGQQGKFAEAIRVSDQSTTYALMGDKPQLELARMLQFCSFVNFWRCGALEAARYSLVSMRQDARRDSSYAGLTELASAMLGLADGKWRLASQRADRLVDRLSVFDVHCLAPFANAVLALALAALGEKEASRRSIRLAEGPSIGVSQMLLGYLRLLTLRARQWNHDTDTAGQALKLANWARAEELSAVELLALHTLAMEERIDARGYIGRTRNVAGVVEPPLSNNVLAHCEELVSGVSAWETPATRSLSELGMWMPLPLTDALSAREREIALFASQGYSSRWIAEQFHLSVRTVDTHLRHVFTKLKVAGRDELRQWFRRDHQTW